jgi:AraC-like DNA-binding protein
MEARFTSVLIGPYLTDDLTQGRIQEQAEKMQLPMQLLPSLLSFYMVLPVYQDPSALMTIVSTLGEHLWGSEKFHVVDVNYEQRIRPSYAPSANIPIEQENILLQMEQMEARYAYENELMEIVSKGQTSRVEGVMKNVSLLNFQPRHADPLRNMKNYCIVCNTLLRKAAQQGGVHPFHLDIISSRFARTIENTSTQEQCADLIGQMLRDYCYLVRNNSGTLYSAIIQNTLLYMEENISGDLSLTTLARLMDVTPSYLSARFHRETGHTMAEHITDLRMKTALQLLKNTRLQVQSVAQLCGFSDPNYFGKQFKRFYGVTPLQYRKSQGTFTDVFP